jgi:glyoxylate/succinic semialdehyde reductase
MFCRGGVLLEAPVSGSKVPAETGTLVFLCGGPKEVYEGVYPALESMGKASFLFGPVGQGSKVKLIVNMMMGNIMTTLSEGMILSEALNLDSTELLKVLDLSAIAAPILQVKGWLLNINHSTQQFQPHEYSLSR